MSRHKKTRQQKMRADLRRSRDEAPASSASPQPVPSTFSLQQVYVAKHPNLAVELEHKNIFTDVRKTLILTSLILLSQLFLLFILKNHVVRFPMISGLY